MLIAFDKYCLQEKIGEGNFGSVFKGYNTRTREKLAIKVEPKAYDLKLLKNETKIYYFLNGLKGVPKVKWFGCDENNYYMVMDLLSFSLEDKRNNAKEHKFSLQLCFSIGSQILDILETIHSKGIIHRDIKPANFMLNEKQDQIYIIDFGFCRTYLDANGQHIKSKKISSIIGSPLFASISCYELNEPSRRDDLESLAYMLCYFYLGYFEESLDFKRDELPSLIPCKLKNLLEKIKSLSFDEEPNYFSLKQLIK
jgi:serine/threonine protein kinase